MPAHALHPSRWPLRTRIVAGVVILLTAMSLVIGGVSVLFLDRYLQNQLRTQLDSAASRSLAPRNGDGDGDRGGFRGSGYGPQSLFSPGQSEGTLNATFRDGAVLKAGVLDASGAGKPLGDAATAVLLALPTDRVYRRVDLGDDLGDYLVAAFKTSGGDTLVVGLPMENVEATVGRLLLVVVGVTVFGLILAAAAGSFIVRVSLRPLHRMAATASRVAELPLERGDVALGVRVPESDSDPRTEVGQVGVALNRMLGHIALALQARNASEARMRRFVADASHELRTPLASIRGYAELTRRREDDLSPDVRHALGRVESEAVRMTGLVEDLLLLARLDEGAAAAHLRHDEVDLSSVVVDCVSDARMLGADHRWSLDLPAEPVAVEGDAGRLRQVLTNLLANARVHTPAGTTVSTRLTLPDADTVLLEVSDDGPGIPEPLVAEVFERFTRADSSRSRAAGSTGLGLSIVASVVDAHCGRVEVTSRPGRTTFSVTLPRLHGAGLAASDLVTAG